MSIGTASSVEKGSFGRSLISSWIQSSKFFAKFEVWENSKCSKLGHGSALCAVARLWSRQREGKGGMRQGCAQSAALA